MFKVKTKISLLGDPIIDYWEKFDDTEIICMGGSLNLEYNLCKLIKQDLLSCNTFFCAAYCQPTFDEIKNDFCDFRLFHAKKYIEFDNDVWNRENHPLHPLDSKEVEVSSYWKTPVIAESYMLIISNYNKKFVETNWNLLDNEYYDLILVDSKYKLDKLNSLREKGKTIIFRMSEYDEDLELDFIPDYTIRTNSKLGYVNLYEKLTNVYTARFNYINTEDDLSSGNDIGAGDVFTACLASCLSRNLKNINKTVLIDAIKYSVIHTTNAIKNSTNTCSIK